MKSRTPRRSDRETTRPHLGAGWFRLGSDGGRLLRCLFHREDLVRLGRPASVDEPKPDEDRHQCCEHERADGANQSDLSEDRES